MNNVILNDIRNKISFFRTFFKLKKFINDKTPTGLKLQNNPKNRVEIRIIKIILTKGIAVPIL